MKHHIILLFLLSLIVIPSAARKQRRNATMKRATPASYMPEAEEAMQAYNFDHAIECYEKERALLEKKKQPTTDVDERLQAALKANAKLHATERITIIDSVVCNAADAMRVIRLSRESGRIDTYASTYHTKDASGATLYENELGNKRYLTLPSAQRLAVADRLGDDWTAPTLLSGLNEDDICQNFPFLLSDGMTLYYAAKGPESMGGYDIFVTRADGEDGEFLTPENIGFPFNSPANDYLLAIDEYALLGWFVSDRRQPEGKVCVYTFIPNQTREVYGDEVNTQQLRSLARLTSIRETWMRPEKVKAAQKRLTDLRSGKGDAAPATHDFTFVIDDQRTYTSIEDFHSPAAKQQMKKWLQLKNSVQTDTEVLNRLRDNYAVSDAGQRQQLARTINRLEATYYPQQEQLRQLAKEIRNTEITYK